MDSRHEQQGSSSSLIAGIDIGGTKCAVTLGIQTGDKMEILSREMFDTRDAEPEEMLDCLCRSARHQMRSRGLDSELLNAVGISCGGPLDVKKGLILSPPNLPGWDRIPAVDLIQRHLGVQTSIQNDANACALAEWKFGAGRGYSHLIFLTFGTGLGAGMVLSGRLHSGANDMAGEIGHVRLTAEGPIGYGKRGSAEGYCSGNGIRQLALSELEHPTASVRSSCLYRLADKPEKVTAKSVADLADAGDALCCDIYRRSGEMLGHTLAILIDIINPEIIVIGSIFSRSRHLLWDAAKEVIEREALPMSAHACRVVASELGDRVGDYAALSVALGEC